MPNLQAIKSNLEKLGLSRNEIAVYSSLLELGEVTVGPLIKKTGLHRQIVYNTLEVLQARDLVVQRVKSNRQNYKVGNIEAFIQKAESQRQTARDLVGELKNFTTAAKFQQEVKIYEGVAGLLEAQIANITRQPRKTTFNIIGAGGTTWFEQMQVNNTLKKYEKIRRERRVNTNFVTFESQRAEVEQIIKQDVSQGPERGKHYRFLSEHLANPVVTQIWSDRVVFIIYGQPIIVLEIKNPQLVENFNNYFIALWKMGKV